MSFLSDTSYSEFLNKCLRAFDDAAARPHVVEKLEDWRRQYSSYRMAERAAELLNQLRGKPFALDLDDALSLQAATYLLSGSSAEALAGFKGFVVDDDFLATQDIRRFQPHAVYPRSRTRDVEAVIFSLSGGVPNDGAATYLANDYRERFIDQRRYAKVLEQRRSFDPNAVVLYPLYREIHTVSMMAQFVRRANQGVCGISLSPTPLLHEHYDATLVEPFFYLWPLIFHTLDPDLVHLNVGWGIQALALSPFIPDRRRTVVDFYEVLSFLPDAYFEKTHSSAEEVRLGEAHFVKNYDHVMHLCAEEISTRLAEKYDTQASIVSVTEYLEEPTYNTPSANDGTIRLVYGGCMLATNNPDDLYYKAFVKVAPHFARDNLHLYIYNSPYVHGIVENDGLKEVIQRLGLTNAHPCTPLKLDDFARKISEYDYGITLLRPKDMEAVEYHYFMATKVLTYLRAGLPVVIDADNRFMASLVSRYQIGVVLQDYDLENVPEILNNADLTSLKRNVVKFRNEFSIEKGGAKVLSLYHEILEPAHRRRVFPVTDGAPSAPMTVERRPAFDEQIESMARAENRLYYRDQSSQTMASLANYAQELDPTVIVELGTLAGLSLRTWIASAQHAKIYAVDLSFKKLHETMRFLPADLSRVTLLEQDILKTDFPSLWTSQDRVIFFVDAHDLPGVPIMEYVLTTALPSLPDGSMVIVDDLWFSEERLTHANAGSFLETRVVGEIDELQCFEGHYAPYHAGGSFMGFAEVLPLLEFVNAHGIPLIHEEGGKHVSFVWRKEYLRRSEEPAGQTAAGPGRACGCVLHNPLASVPTSPALAEQMRRIAAGYRDGRIREAAETLSRLVVQHPHDQGLSYGLAVCLARGGMLPQAKDVLEQNLKDVNHPRYQQLYDDLTQRVGASEGPQLPEPESRPGTCGVTIFAMPKPFVGHNAVIQRNAIRSWARLHPRPEIILFGNEPGIREMAAEIGARHLPDVGRNEFGTPLVNKLFQAAEAHASHTVLAYVNADMILFQDFVEAVQKVQAGLPIFLLIGQRWDIPILEHIDFDRQDWQEALQRQMQEHAMLHAECGLDYFVFPKGAYPEIPPFAIGRTAWDNWLVMDPHKRGVPVVDGTEFITAVHQEHDYGHVAGGRQEAWAGVEAARNQALLGTTDNSGCTSGAGRALRRDGTLVAVEPRQPWHVTEVYREQRSAWLLKQADRLMAVGNRELAACKWEEAIVSQDALLAWRLMGNVKSEDADYSGLAKRYATSCIRLAQCYTEMGCEERVVATYTRLLENPRIQMPKAQRDTLVRARDQLARLAQERRSSTSSSVVPERLDVTSRAGQTQDVQPPQGCRPATATPAQTEPWDCEGVPGQPSQALADLERKYRSMPDGTRAKHDAAVRLSGLFRRAGLAEKSRALETEAATLRGTRNSRGTVPQATDQREVTPAAGHRPKVSVITACRNAERYLPECLDSILKQTMPEWELFLLDDGSTDGTRRIIEDYARRDARIKAYCFDDDTGPYVRRNFAIGRARADFIVIHDADDIMCPTKLEILCGEINKDETLAMVGSNCRTFLDEYRGPEYTEYNRLPLAHDEIMAGFTSWCHVMNHGSAIIRKALFAEIGLYDENPFAADSFWSAKLAACCEAGQPVRVKNVPECLTLIRVHATDHTRLLSALDPRNRRMRYRQYCECKLRLIRDRMKSAPGTDIGRELRQCTCSDFLTRFKAQITAWESEPLGDRVIPEFLQSAVRLFNQGYYVSCANILNGVEAFEPSIAARVIGYDLLGGMASFALGMKERGLTHLDREIQQHGSPGARQFREDILESSAPLDVQQWCQENAERFTLGLMAAEVEGSATGASRAGVSQKQQVAL